MVDDKIVQEIIERLVRLETKLDNYNGLREKLEFTYMLAIKHEDYIKEVKDNQKWLWRTLIASIIGLIANLIIFYLSR